MSFINNGRKKRQTEKLDFIDISSDKDQDPLLFEEQTGSKKKPTIFDQMAHDQSASSTEPITWDPEPFGEQNSTPIPRTDNETVIEPEVNSLDELVVNEVLDQPSEEENKNHEETEKQPNNDESTSLNSTGMDEIKTEIVDLNTLIQDRFVTVDKHLHKLNNDFEAKLKYDQHKDKVIDNLHKELQMYKDNSFQERLTPIIMDLILSIDRTGKILKGLPQDEEFKKFIKVIKESIIDLEDILYKQGVEAYEEEGTSFDSNRQKVVKTVKTNQPELDKQIAERLGKGYERDERIIRKELVTVYVYEAASNE